MTTETWLPVVGFEGRYEVSDHGRVRSTHGRTARRVLSGGLYTGGYPGVTLRKDGRRHSRLIHKLVAEAFIGPRPPGMQCCHGDGCRTNNALSNLRWDTTVNNHADRAAHGTAPRGRLNPSAKLTELQVLAIRSDQRLLRQIASDHGISKSQAWSIRHRRTWAHV